MSAVLKFILLLLLFAGFILLTIYTEVTVRFGALIIALYVLDAVIGSRQESKK